MNLTGLFTVIQKTLADQGFFLCKHLRNDMTTSHFILNEDDVVRKKISGDFGYEAFYGNWLEVREVSRRNGAKYNTSYYLVICECERSSAKDVKKIKLKSAQTERTLVTKVQQFAEGYRQYLSGKALVAQIEAYLQDREYR